MELQIWDSAAKRKRYNSSSVDDSEASFAKAPVKTSAISNKSSTLINYENALTDGSRLSSSRQICTPSAKRTEFLTPEYAVSGWMSWGRLARSYV